MNILLAEDDTGTRESIVEILNQDGFQVVAACDGKEAIELWGESTVDIVLLDIMMPEKTGYEVCREIRKSDPSVPVMFVSAKSEEVDVVVGLELGADDFLRKPFGKHELLARVRALLRRNRQNSGELRATEGENEIDLTPREIRILELLKKYYPSPATRDEILNYCWSMDYFPGSRTLDQHISNLRKKIGEQFIETVRGTGYRMGK